MSAAHIKYGTRALGAQRRQAVPIYPLDHTYQMIDAGPCMKRTRRRGLVTVPH